MNVVLPVSTLFCLFVFYHQARIIGFTLQDAQAMVLATNTILL